MKFNDLFRNKFYRQCWKMMFFILGTIALCKVTAGGFGAVIAVIGIWGALTRRPAYALICFAFLPFLTVMNPIAFGFGSILGISARLGMPLMTLAMIVAAASRRGRQGIPLAGLWVYALVAFVSSIDGYAPMISYLKIINFVLFAVGIYVGTRNIDKDYQGLLQLRAFFFSFSVFIIIGSLALNYINPYAAHFQSAGWFAGDVGAGNAAVEARIVATGDAGLLCGVVNHSQCLGPTAACVAGWLLMDMLFIEKRFMVGHVVTLLFCPYVSYLTKSRTSLLALLVVFFMVVMYAVPKFRVAPILKRRIRSMMMTLLFLFILGGIGLEVTTGGVHKWLVKHNLNNEEEVSMQTLTASRMGLIEAGLYDFRQNPLLGKGFQVSYEHQFLNTKGKLILSAPIEKGFLPTMILGETGVVGALVFSIFLLVFYATCSRKQYYATLALFTTYLASNLGEATFFSPGGTGGPEWLISLVGGFVIDMTAAVQRRNNGFPAGFFQMMWGPALPNQNHRRQI